MSKISTTRSSALVLAALPAVDAGALQ